MYIHDFETLKLLESKFYIEEFQTGTSEELEYVLVEIENTIIALEKEYKNLCHSQWYSWKLQKKKNTMQDIFAEMEKSVLNDIACKISILNMLKKELEENKTD